MRSAAPSLLAAAAAASAAPHLLLGGGLLPPLLLLLLPLHLPAIASAQDDGGRDSSSSATSPPPSETETLTTTTTTDDTNITYADVLSFLGNRTVEALSPHVTLDQFVSFLHSELNQELDYDPSEAGDGDGSEKAAREHWEDIVLFEWEKCLRDDLLLGDPCPFVMCHYHDETEHGKMSGNERQGKVLEAIERATPGEGPEDEAYVEQTETRMKTVFNGQGIWCGYVRILATVAEKVLCESPSRCNVTPLIMQMKMLPSTLQTMLDAISYLYEEDGEEVPEFVRRERRRMMAKEGNLEEQEEEYHRGGGRAERRRLRLGESSVDADGETRRLEADDYNMTGQEPIEWEFPTVDVLLCPGVITESDIQEFEGHDDPHRIDVTEEMTSWLLNITGSVGKDDAFVREYLADSIYWTSSRAKRLYEDNEAGGGTVSARGRFWQDVFKYTLATNTCDGVFKNRLRWIADLRTSPDFSYLSVTYEPGEYGDRDDWCIVSMVAGIATLNEVCAVEIQPDYEPENDKASWLVQTGIPEQRPWFDHGLDGTGQVVAVSDTGIDTKNCYVWDSNVAVPMQGRNDAHRKIVHYIPHADTSDDTHGHGTHVVTTVAGRLHGAKEGEVGGPADGVARGAKIAFMDIARADGSFSIPNSYDLLMTGRRNQQGLPIAHIHSASWGSSQIRNEYTSQAKYFDDFMFDNDEFLLILAAGNDGRGDHPSSVSSPATFKNGISVGASNSFGSDLGRDSLGPTYLADFSSRGPTLDGRKKPEVVAPGKSIISGAVNPSFASSECHAGITDKAGTSMATPVVSGTAALIRQYFEEGWYPQGRKGSGSSMSPSGALVKAVLLNGAQPNMRGVDNGVGTFGERKITPVSVYDNNIGFGRIDLSYSLYLEGFSDVQAEVWDRQEVVDRAVRRYTVTVNKSNGCTFEHLSVTLVWVEEASVPGCTRCVLNDLDLHVTKKGEEGKIHYPNGGTEKDSVNNAERVVVPSVEHDDTFILHVTGSNLDRPKQKFALVATGCFGGVPDSLDKSSEVFDNDNSAGKMSTRMIIIISVCSVVGFLIICICGVCLCRRRRKK